VTVFVAMVQVLGVVGGAAAFLCVIWPAIRQQRRMGEKLEALIDDPALKETIAFYASFAPSRKEKS